MAAVYRETRIVDIEDFKWVQDESGRAHKQVDCISRHTVAIEVDIDGIFKHLARRAARSKGGKAVLGSGLVRAKRVRV